jgi:uncharacterized protein YsxB (DUF464 family)
MEDQNRINEYTTRLKTLNGQIADYDRQLILLEEKKKQMEEKLMAAFNTTDINELQKIAESYTEDIKLKEAQLNAIA